MKKITFPVIIFYILNGFASCNIADTDLPEWDAELLGPLALSHLRLEDFSELNNLTFSAAVSLNDLGLDANFPPPYPAIHITSVGPYDLQLFKEFYEVIADSAEIIIGLYNNLPQTIQAGTALEYRNKASGELIYTYYIAEDIQSGESFIEEITLLNQTIEEEIEVYLLELGISGTTTQLHTDDNIETTFELVFIKIAQASIKPNQAVHVADTTNFNLTGDALNATTIEGTFFTFIDNGYPFSGEIQAYFLSNDAGVTYDSLFKKDPAQTGYSIASPVLDPAAGTVIESRESKLVSEMDKDKVSRIIESKKVYFKISLTSPATQPIIAENTNEIRVQMTGDLKIALNN